MNWLVHRVAVSTYYKDSLADILHVWTLSELADAHLLIDELERAEAAAQTKD